MSRVLLTSTQVAQRAGQSVHAFLANKKLYDPLKYDKTKQKEKRCMETYWWLNDTYWGVNKSSKYGNTVKWYSDRVTELYKKIGAGGLINV